MSRIASYVRVSTGRQRDKATDEMQRGSIKEYAKRFDIPEPHEFTDLAVSSRQLFERRPGSSALLSAAKAGQVEKLIVYRLDRLGRDDGTSDTTIAAGKLWRSGVREIHAVSQGLVLKNDANGRLMLTLHAGIGGYERASIIQRTNDAKWRLAKSDERWLGGPSPFGYRIKGLSKQARLEVYEPEAEWVRRIFEWAAEGRGCRTIAKELNTLGVLSPRAAERAKPNDTRAARGEPSDKRPVRSEWWPASVRRVLTNRLYFGQADWGKYKVIWDEENGENIKARLQLRPEDQWVKRPPCPAIVSKELFDRVQAILVRTETVARAHAKRDYLLSGLIRCACGKTFTGVASRYSTGERDDAGNIKERLYYKCAARFGKDGFQKQRCDSPTIPASDLEKAVWEYVSGFLARPAEAKKELEAKIVAEGGKNRSVADEIREMETALARIAEGRKAILRQAGLGNFTDAEIAEAVRENREREANLQARLEPLRQVKADQKKLELDLDWAGRLLGQLREKLIEGDLTFASKQQFVRALVGQITVDRGPDGRAQVRVKFRFDRDFERFERFEESNDPSGEGGGQEQPRPPRRGGSNRVGVITNVEKIEACQPAETEILALDSLLNHRRPERS